MGYSFGTQNLIAAKQRLKAEAEKGNCYAAFECGLYDPVDSPLSSHNMAFFANSKDAEAYRELHSLPDGIFFIEPIEMLRKVIDRQLTELDSTVRLRLIQQQLKERSEAIDRKRRRIGFNT